MEDMPKSTRRVGGCIIMLKFVSNIRYTVKKSMKQNK